MKNERKLVKSYYKTTFQCIENIQSRKYNLASEIATNKIQLCKKIINEDDIENSAIKNISLLFGICFKALEELAEIGSIVLSKNWISYPKKVQRVWYLLQNCKDRLGYALSPLNFPDDKINFIIDFIQDIEIQIEAMYGKGLYNSPEVIIEECVCSICNQDPRSCPHVENQIYDGKICRIVVTKMKKGSHVASTQNPKDKRCRIWPWNFKENLEDGGLIIENVPIIISFRIDGFLYDD